MTEPNTLAAAHQSLRRLLEFQWVDHGMGKMTCRSCGATKWVDYGDHEQPASEQVEPCSRSCPWRVAAECLGEGA